MTKRIYICDNCGEVGHNRQTCGQPDPQRPRRKTYEQRLDEHKPGLRQMLGTMPDSEVGAHYGVSRQRIEQYRKRLGVAAHFEPLEPTNEQAALLGTMPDEALAQCFGIVSHVVSRWRHARNIAAYDVWEEHERTFAPIKDRLGKVSDPTLAREIGVPASLVFRYRERYGIKTEIISPACEGFVKIDRGEIARLFHEGRSDAEIAAAVGSTTKSVGRIRSRELRLLRRSKNPSPGS
jgi:hypothetical protein